VKREVTVAGITGLIFSALLGLFIVLGSRNLSHFDAVLVGYTFAVLFATFGIVYRYAMWLQRPPTAMYWKRGWQVFFQPANLSRNVVNWLKRVLGDIALNGFIFKRGTTRWMAHWLIMWGCTTAILITFPLVFGWLHFESVPPDIHSYQVFIFGYPSFEFRVESWSAFLLFHGLVWSALLVIPGVMLAMRRRMRDEGVAALQHFSEDFLPLILLFAVSVTGLLLTASYTWMKGYGYEFLSLLHAATVIFTLLWLPFGKFFHIFQRPAQLGVSFYKDAGKNSKSANCKRCGKPFSSEMHIQDLIEVEKKLGYAYESDGIEHYQWICPPCRRASLAIAQGYLMSEQTCSGSSPKQMPAPKYANPGLNEGPLGTEDDENFHP
jgi:hypothetical protein